MSTWTPAIVLAQAGPRELDVWRVIEAQHHISTRKLVDSLEEQALLEALVEDVKPPATALADGLHFLLWTPFRYPPLRYGSRFGRRDERGIWYGACDRASALAERAYYKLLFLDGCPELAPLQTTETAFQATFAATRFVDLSARPFGLEEALISSPASYAVSQPLGSTMRAGGVEAFAFVSARARPRGLNVGLFEPVFTGAPFGLETWTCLTTLEGVELSHLIAGQHAFPRSQFLRKGRLPRPGLEA